MYTQAREQYTETWSVQSLDIVLGLVGGVSGVVWAVFAFTIDDFESFRFENALIGSIYPTSPFEGNLEDPANPSTSTVNTENEAKH